MLDYVSNADYETGYVDAMVSNKKEYEQIKELFGGATCTGVRPYFSESVNDILPLFERHSVSSPEFKAFRFINCTGHVENNKAVLDGTLYHYEFAGLEIKLY